MDPYMSDINILRKKCSFIDMITRAICLTTIRDFFSVSKYDTLCHKNLEKINKWSRHAGIIGLYHIALRCHN